MYVLNGGQVSLPDLFQPLEFVLFLFEGFFQRSVEFLEMLDLVGEEGFLFVDFLALFFAEEVLLCGLLKLRVLAIAEVRVGCFNFSLGV